MFYQKEMLPQKVEVLIDHSSRIRYLCFSPNNEQLASCSSDLTIIIYDSITFHPNYKLENHTKTITCLDYNKKKS